MYQQPKDRNERNGKTRGLLGDARTDAGSDEQTEGGQPPEKVEDRPRAGAVKPEDYPS